MQTDNAVAVADNAVAQSVVHTAKPEVRIFETPLIQTVYQDGYALKTSDETRLDLDENHVNVRVLGAMVYRTTQTSKFPDTMGKKVAVNNTSILIEVLDPPTPDWTFISMSASNTKFQALLATPALLLGASMIPGAGLNKTTIQSVLEWKQTVLGSAPLNSALQLPRIPLRFKTVNWSVSKKNALQALVLVPTKGKMLDDFDLRQSFEFNETIYTYQDVVRLWVEKVGRLAEYFKSGKDPHGSFEFVSGFYYSNSDTCVKMNGGEVVTKTPTPKIEILQAGTTELTTV